MSTFRVTVGLCLTTSQLERQPVLSSRNFDPASRTLRKRNADDDDMDDTVEKNVEGLADAIVAQDEEARAQELVSPLFRLNKL